MYADEIEEVNSNSKQKKKLVSNQKFNYSLKDIIYRKK